MRNIIYALVDPRNDVIMYVGKSTVDLSRPLSHLSYSHSPKVRDWVEQLGKDWLYPRIEILEEGIALEMLSEKEKLWIQAVSSYNPSILNLQNVPNTNVDLMEKEEIQDFDNISALIGNVGGILKRARLVRGINQQEFAKECGFSRSTISLVERGENVNLHTIQRMFLVLRGLDMRTKIVSQRCVNYEKDEHNNL
jgi:DNA-binding XRE family transcriptional regulator